MAFVRRRCYAKCQSFHSPIPQAVVEEVSGLIAIFLVEKFRGCNVAAYITYNDTSPLSATATVSAAFKIQTCCSLITRVPVGLGFRV